MCKGSRASIVIEKAAAPEMRMRVWRLREAVHLPGQYEPPLLLLIWEIGHNFVGVSRVVYPAEYFAAASTREM